MCPHTPPCPPPATTPSIPSSGRSGWCPGPSAIRRPTAEALTGRARRGRHDPAGVAGVATLVPVTRLPDGALPGERPPEADDDLPFARRACWTLPTAPCSTRRARRLVRATLRAWTGSEFLAAGDAATETAEAAELLVSELVTNALRHGRGAPVLALLVRDGVLRCEVEDEARVPARVRDTTPDDDEDGRGLLIVESLSRCWGTRPTRRGKAVWFELALPYGPSC
ncbi:MAG: ATP-binding protein [Thermobispora bispora]|nr:ATP-binding protein [Thermobispora bispora]